jgi:hypothetical protein
VYGSFNPLQNMTGNQNFMRCENQTQLLPLVLVGQFREYELIQGQHKKAVCRPFNELAHKL